MKRHYKKPEAPEPGLKRYVVKYIAFGVEFSCEEDAVNRTEAKKKFEETHSYLAEISSIKKKRGT